MKKWFFTLAASLVLASCGDGSSTDFVIQVEDTPSDAMSELEDLGGGVLTQTMGLESAYETESEANAISYVIPSSEDNDDGTLHMIFTENGKGGTAIEVTLDLPNIISSDMILSERKAERELKKQMNKWAKARSDGSAAYEKDQIAITVDALTFALQKWDSMDDPEALLADADMGAMFDAEGEGFGSDSGYGTSDDFEDNSADDSYDGADDFDASMDDAEYASDDASDGWGD